LFFPFFLILFYFFLLKTLNQRHLRVAFFVPETNALQMHIALLEAIRDVVIGRAYLYNAIDFSGWFKLAWA